VVISGGTNALQLMWILLTEGYCPTAVIVRRGAGLGAGVCIAMLSAEGKQGLERQSKRWRDLEWWSVVCSVVDSPGQHTAAVVCSTCPSTHTLPLSLCLGSTRAHGGCGASQEPTA